MDAVVERHWPAGLTRIPYWVYTDPDVLALEQKRIFEGPVWNFLCLETELPTIGDYRTTFVGTMPVVVARAEDGELCAFENRCAHRGALICLDDGGTAKDFQCVYHSWRYDLRGNLRSIAFARGVNGKGGMPADFDMTATARASCASPRSAAWCSARFRPTRPNSKPGSAPRSSAACAACWATAGWRSSAASPRRCRTTGSSISRTCATPTTPACCTCSSPPSASPASVPAAACW